MKNLNNYSLKVGSVSAFKTVKATGYMLKTPRKHLAFTAALPALFLALVVAMPAQAKTEAGQFEVSPFIGYHAFENDQNLDDGLTYGLRLGYSFTPNWAIEGAVSFVETNVDDPNRPAAEGQFTGPSDDVDLMLYQLDALYHFRPENKLSPYLVLGYGAADYDPGISDKDMSTFNVGVGAKYWIADNLAMRFDLRDHLVGEVFQESYNNVSATIGISYAFGGEPKSVAAVSDVRSPEPAVVADDVIVLAFEDIHFNLDQSALTNEAKTILRKSVSILKQNPKAKVRIAGYTSASGTIEYNQALSERRATAIKHHLIEQGISANRLSTIGYGETRPDRHERTPSNVNSGAAQKNMRALFEIVVE